MQPRPPSLTGKRKREEDTQSHDQKAAIQIITGSYERALQGILATIAFGDNGSDTSAVIFSNNFLINAHSSSIRSLAVSPPSVATSNQPAKRILATGGADERINLYQIAASYTPSTSKVNFTGLGFSQNRELGSLLHHSSTITTLFFPSRGKLLSASLDNKIAISRVRDWTVLSEIRAPVPKIQGRPSGDTATPGEVPAGINDVAVHPSAKLCLSVGQGEKCMRLWNLVTGKKAGVLTFGKNILSQVGEGRWRDGEARSVVWSPTGEEFAVGFERGAVIYDLACTIRGVARVDGTKVCCMKYVPQIVKQYENDNGESRNGTSMASERSALAVSTEDGRVLFFDTQPADGTQISSASAVEHVESVMSKTSKNAMCQCIAQLGKQSRGTRIKDFAILSPESNVQKLLVVTGTSDGTVQIWSLDRSNLSEPARTSALGPPKKAAKAIDPEHINGAFPLRVNQIGELLGAYQTGKRITCLEAFSMTPTTPLAERNGVNGDNQDEDEDDFGGFADLIDLEVSPAESGHHTHSPNLI